MFFSCFALLRCRPFCIVFVLYTLYIYIYLFIYLFIFIFVFINRLDTKTLLALFPPEDKDFRNRAKKHLHIEGAQYWGNFLHPKYLTRKNNRGMQFCTMICTDGVSISVLYSYPPSEEIRKKYLKRWLESFGNVAQAESISESSNFNNNINNSNIDSSSASTSPPLPPSLPQPPSFPPDPVPNPRAPILPPRKSNSPIYMDDLLPSQLQKYRDRRLVAIDPNMGDLWFAVSKFLNGTEWNKMR